MSILKNLFKPKSKLKPSTDLKLCIINEESDDFYEVLGITKERKEELLALCKKEYKTRNDLSETLANIVDNCNHVNEIVICVILIERLRETSNNPLNMLKQIFE